MRPRHPARARADGVNDDAWVLNPFCREIDEALKKERNPVGHLRRKRALEADPLSATARALSAQIKACGRAIEGLVRVRKTVARGSCWRPRGSRPCPTLMDTLRVLAYRAETAMATAVAPALHDPETARSLLESLFRSVPSRHPDQSAGTLTLRLLLWSEPLVERFRDDRSHQSPRQPASATGNGKRPERSVAQ